MSNKEIVIDTVCNHYKQERKNVLSRSRKQEYVIPRQIISFMLLKFTKMSLKAIGGIIKGGDHTSAIARIAAARQLIDGNETHRNNVNYLLIHFGNIFYTDKVKKCEIEPLQPETIIDTVLDYFNQTREEIFIRTKRREVVETRQIITYFLMKYCLLTQKESANYFDRHRSSIGNSIIKVNNYIDTDEVFRNSINDMDKTFTAMMQMEIQVAEVA